MKKLLIFILIAVVSCNNANKTGSSYNNSNNDNTEQGGTSSTDNNKEWLNKISGRNIQNSKVNYEFDLNGNIIVNGEKRWTFLKYLGDNKGLYSQEIDPSYMLFNLESTQKTTVYAILTIEDPNDMIYFLDGYKITSWTENYKIKMRAFYSGNKSEPDLANWSAYPHMT